MSQNKYDTYANGSTDSSDGGDGDYNDTELKFTPHASVEATLGRLFGTESDYGQSLGLNLEDVELTDGGLYFDASSGKFKLFSVKEAAGLSQADAMERGVDLDVDDFDDYITKTYFGEQYTYDLIAARVEGTDEIEASSKRRDFEQTGGGVEFGDFEYFDGEPVPVAESTITWLDGSDEYGPSATSTGVAETLSSLGEDLITADDQVQDWLADTTGDNLLRDELEGRRVEYFLVTKESDESGYNYFAPVFIDKSTGEQVPRTNQAGGDDGSDGDDSGNADSGSGSTATAPGTYPEPVSEFINSAGNLDLTPDRAETLLDDMVEDSENALTAEHIEEAGGSGVIVEEVV